MSVRESHLPELHRILRTDRYIDHARWASGDVLPALVDADQRHGEFSAAYEERFEEAIDEGVSIYGDMPPLTQAAHERRMALLDALPVGDLSEKVVVDFGVGSWTVACIAPRLQQCGLAIGIDISEAAIRESARISFENPYPYGDRWLYLSSDGRTIDLNDQTVDLLFAGEVIEHIDHTDAWLDEVHRVLRPGGTLILTTPNADAPLYAARGEQWCVGPEHVALMGWDELQRRLEPRFEIVVAKGFNMSFHGALDGGVLDLELAREWAACCEERPDLDHMGGVPSAPGCN
jgi:SAM-dependent methyltransferase